MDSSRDDRLTATLEELRPEPRPEFAAELDRRAAAGFPRRSRLAALRERLRALAPHRVLVPVGAAATLLLVVAVALTAGGGSSEDSSESGVGTLNFLNEADGAGESAAEPAEARSDAPAASIQDSAGRLDGAASRAPKRSVERNARLDVGVPADRVPDAAAQALAIVDANNGIVMRSSLEQGSERPQVALFDLRIPSGQLSDALAEFSELGEVLSRKDRSADITAPTVGTAERLQDSRARIEGLLGQLAAASTEAERETVEAELRRERRHAARLRARLADLKRRANLSQVSLTIAATDGSSAGGGWSVGDAIDDAGRVLSIAAAVAIVALAVLVPLALIALLVLLARRAWLRRARARALA